jgi:cell division protein FtsA
MKHFEAIRGQPGTLAVLDIGGAKVVAFIARLHEGGEIEVLGVGHQLSKGIRSGQIQDAGEAQHSITAAVHAAEQMAGETVESIFVSVNGAHLRSRTVVVELDVTREGVSDEDILDLIHEGSLSAEEDDREMIHIIPVQYYLDKAKGLTDPRGMVGAVLGAELHIVSADRLTLQNISNTIARCHLNTLGYIMAPLASARAVLTPDEMELGASVIDMGAGTTSACVYAHGKPIHSVSIPVGGKHVTSDIARGLSTSLAQAERIKTLYASAVGSPKDAESMIDVPQLGDDEADEEAAAQIPRSHLTGVVRPRMEEMFELVQQKLDDAGVDKVSGRHCVLTGGGSQMIGVYDLATKMLSKQVRKGKPTAIDGLADAANGPSFATAVGMLFMLTQPSWEDRLMLKPRRSFGMGGLGKKLLGWMRENV